MDTCRQRPAHARSKSYIHLQSIAKSTCLPDIRSIPRSRAHWCLHSGCRGAKAGAALPTLARYPGQHAIRSPQGIHSRRIQGAPRRHELQHRARKPCRARNPDTCCKLHHHSVSNKRARSTICAVHPPVDPPMPFYVATISKCNCPIILVQCLSFLLVRAARLPCLWTQLVSLHAYVAVAT